MGCGCKAGKGGVAGKAKERKPVFVNITMERRRMRQWTVGKRASVCAQCELCTRRFGLVWCGTPLLLRPVAWLWSALRHATRPAFRGCGCCLNLKWRMPNQHCPHKHW